MLEVTGLSKTYGTLRSVRELSFRAEGCEAVGLLGPNGAGKSTTMRMLAGYLAPSAGRIELNGLCMEDRPREVKRQIGYLPEIPPLYPELTVTEQLRFVCELRNIPAKRIRCERERVCELLQISDVAGRVIGHLSKGYRQRVGFAAALVGEPKLLILDEPTVGLDPRQVIEIRRLIRDLATRMTVLISSHMLSEIASVCTHLLIMNRGELLADGSAREITDRYRDQAILTVAVRGDRALATAVLSACIQGKGTLRMEEQPAADRTVYTLCTPKGTEMAEAVFQALARHSDALTLTSLQDQAPTLEDVFIDITRGRPVLTPEGLQREGAEA